MVTFTCSYISRVWTDTRTVCLTQKYVESLYFFHMSPIGWMPVYFQGQEVNVLNALTLYGENEKYFSDIKKCSVWWCGKCIYFFCGWKYSKITVVLQQQQSFSDSFFTLFWTGSLQILRCITFQRLTVYHRLPGPEKGMHTWLHKVLRSLPLQCYYIDFS